MEDYKSGGVHLNLALKYLKEGKTLADKDPIQVSEKMYKATEKALKAMALALGLDEARKAVEQGRRSFALLFDTIDSKVHEEKDVFMVSALLEKPLRNFYLKKLSWRDKDPIEVSSRSTVFTKIVNSIINYAEFQKLSKEVILRDYEQAY
jgi:hypothetical protein